MLHEKVLTRALAGTGQFVDFSGTWINELGSQMTISQANDVVHGTYQSAVSSGGGQTSGSLLGYVDGDLVSFVVHWDQFQAITAWVGQLEAANPQQLNTLWQMTSQVAPGEEWASINAGADSFEKQ
jgi:hypothetical protein